MDHVFHISHVLLINAASSVGGSKYSLAPVLNERNKMTWTVMTRLKIIAGTGKRVAGVIITAARILSDHN